MPKPFEKGDSRINRSGRPKKGDSLTDILNLKLDEKDASGKLLREVVADRLIELAGKGDIMAIRYLMDRVDGKPKESIELNSCKLEARLKEIMNG